jgi:hypothetical protein
MRKMPMLEVSPTGELEAYARRIWTSRRCRCGGKPDWFRNAWVGSVAHLNSKSNFRKCVERLRLVVADCVHRSQRSDFGRRSHAIGIQ